MIWSPEGKFMVYSEWQPVGEIDDPTLKIIEFGIWESTILEDLLGSFLTSWINLP